MAGDHLASLQDGQPWTNREALALLGLLSLTLRLEAALPPPAPPAPEAVSVADDVPDVVAVLLGLIAIGRLVRRLLPAPGPATPGRSLPGDLGEILR
jgi:hypothetical protein